MAGFASAYAQGVGDTVTLEDEYKDLIRVSEGVQPLGEHPFGEQISLYNGALAFNQTDIILPGPGPTVSVSRTFAIKGRNNIKASEGGAFADWELALPRITTLVTRQTNREGWQVPGDRPFDRCSAFAAPAPVESNYDGSDWTPGFWWNGYQLIVPGSGSQDLLKRDPGFDQVPNAIVIDSSGNTAVNIDIVTTTSHWVLGCLPSLQNPGDGYQGEGFIAVDSNGTRYWFDHMVRRWAPSLTKGLDDPPQYGAEDGEADAPQSPTQDILHRWRASLMVTKVVDRFGNWVHYSYDGAKLTAITAKDGRSIVIHYNAGSADPNYIRSITTTGIVDGNAKSRTWTYTYKAASIGSTYDTLWLVTRPDNSRWEFDLADFMTSAGLSLSNYPSRFTVPGDFCSRVRELPNLSWAGYVTTPSGLKGSFIIEPKARGRTDVGSSDVPENCFDPDSTVIGDEYPLIPFVSYPFVLAEKTVTGAGIAPARHWYYEYSPTTWPTTPSWAPDPCDGATCTAWTEVTDPEGHVTRSTFSNRFDASEGKLLHTWVCESGTSCPNATSARRTVDYEYGLPGAGDWHWPDHFGNDLQARTNKEVTERASPMKQRDTRENGDVYHWRVGYNSWLQMNVTVQDNYSDALPELVFLTNQRNDKVHWVLGLPTIRTNWHPQQRVSKFVYDASDNTLSQRWSFGRKVMDYQFDSAGQLSWFQDSLGHRTTLSNYHRGVPQLIKYADNTTKSLVVDDFGQIQSITDETGATTRYNYDNGGRLSHIAYPSGDPVSWSPTNINYQLVTSNEYGVNGKHWRALRTEGANRQLTVYDAALNPVLDAEYDNASTDPSKRGHMTWRAFDADGRLQFQSYPLAYKAWVSVNAPGVQTIYDALGRVTESIASSEQGDLTTHTRYISGNQVKVTDPKGHVTTTTYRGFDTPRYDAAIKVDFNGITTTTIDRDWYGKPETMTQSGTWVPPGTSTPETVSITHDFAYDSYERMCSTYSPETGRTIMGYFGNSELLRWSAAGQGGIVAACAAEPADTNQAKVERSYDARDRVTKINYYPQWSSTDTNPDTAFFYNANGQVHTATRGDATWTMTYNHRGLLTSESLFDDHFKYNYNLIYEYDNLGHRASIRYPQETLTELAPDALGRPTRVDYFVHDVDYAPNGRPRHFVYGNGIVFDEIQNERGLPESVTYAKSGAFYADRNLEYDANANLISIKDCAQDPQDPNCSGIGVPGMSPQATDDRSFVYDEVDRLIDLRSEWIAPDGYPGFAKDHYDYDPLGNVRRRRYQYIDGNNKLQMPNAWYFYNTRNRAEYISPSNNKYDPCRITHTYDTRGNLQNEHRPDDPSCTPPPNGDVNFALTFNQANELVKDQYNTKFAYDARGWRYLQDVGVGEDPARRFFVYDSAGLLRQRIEDGNIPTRYYYLGNRPIARADGPNEVVTYIQPNYQNSPLFETDGAGNVTRSLTFYAYGQPSGASCIGAGPCDSALMPLGFAKAATGGGDLILAEYEHAPGYTGSYPDRETGLLYMGARYQHGPRFISPDPAPLNPLHPAGLNRYAYANNNPVRFTDRTGRSVDGQYHKVTPGAYHLSIRVTPENQALYENDPRFLTDPNTGERYATFGAGPQLESTAVPMSSRLPIPVVMAVPTAVDLVSDINRTTDANRSMHPAANDIRVATPTRYKSEGQFIEALFSADANYGDDVSYGLPGGDGYNSNSYANGLLQAVGAKPLTPPVPTPLSDNPLPKEQFE